MLYEGTSETIKDQKLLSIDFFISAKLLTSSLFIKLTGFLSVNIF